MTRLTLVALVLALAVTTGAEAKLPSSVDLSVAPGGSATVGSPPLTNRIKSMALDVAPSEDDDAFNSLRVFLADLPSKKTRVLACAYFYRGIVNGIDDDERPVIGDVEDQPLATLFLAMCAHLALTIDNASASTAANACGQERLQVPVTITGTKSNASGHFEGDVEPSKRPQLKVRCKLKGDGYSLRVKARKKGTPLRRVVGRRVQLGFQSPADAEGSAGVRVTFRK